MHHHHLSLASRSCHQSNLAGYLLLLMLVSLSSLLSPACGPAVTSASSNPAAAHPPLIANLTTANHHHILYFDQQPHHHRHQSRHRTAGGDDPWLLASTATALAGSARLPAWWYAHVLPAPVTGPLWRARTWALKHPASRTIVIGSLVIVGALTATGHYLVTASIQGDGNTPLNHEASPLVPESLRGQSQPEPPTGDPMLVPIPHFSQQDDSSLVIYPDQTSPASLPPRPSLLEQQRLLETKVNQVRDEQKIIDRIHQLNLELYAHKQGITVAQIPQDERLRLESEQNFKYITNHINELSADNMDRLMKRIDELEGALATLNNAGRPLPANARMIDKIKHQLNIVLQGLAVGLLFVMFL